MRFRLRTLLIIVASILVVLIYGVFSWRAGKANNNELDVFSTSISLGMPRTQVNQLCEDYCAQRHGWGYRPEVERESSIALVESPIAFGATNHVAYIVFDQNVVAAVLVRTPDTKTWKPPAAPADRVADANLEVLATF